MSHEVEKIYPSCYGIGMAIDTIDAVETRNPSPEEIWKDENARKVAEALYAFGASPQKLHTIESMVNPDTKGEKKYDVAAGILTLQQAGLIEQLSLQDSARRIVQELEANNIQELLKKTQQTLTAQQERDVGKYTVTEHKIQHAHAHPDGDSDWTLPRFRLTKQFRTFIENKTIVRRQPAIQKQAA